MLTLSDSCVVVQVRDIIQALEGAGWFLSRQRSSHRQFHHPTNVGCVTVCGAVTDGVATVTVTSIVRQARLERKPR
ncbi:MAG: type II toxin-antitoxin system HicA family toxin [Acidimicrobiales bacterium]